MSVLTNCERRNAQSELFTKYLIVVGLEPDPKKSVV